MQKDISLRKEKKGVLNNNMETTIRRPQRFRAMRNMSNTVMPEQQLPPYTMEEIHAMIAQAEHESAAGLGQDSEEMFRELEEEFAHEDRLAVTAAV